ncbi:hypothetical protein GA0115259_103991, partial [Streptomyces sp. MnatMP-M17]
MAPGADVENGPSVALSPVSGSARSMRRSPPALLSRRDPVPRGDGPIRGAIAELPPVPRGFVPHRGTGGCP